MKKIKELKTVSCNDVKTFNITVEAHLIAGFVPYDTIITAISPPVYGPDGRFNTGSVTTLTQQFVKYED